MSAAIRLINNDKITKIDFGKVKTWTAVEPTGILNFMKIVP